jgi:hypothetical protein
MKRNPHITHCDTLPEGVLLYTKRQMAGAMQVSVRCRTGRMQRGEVSFLKINHRIVRFRPEDALRRLSETSLVCKHPEAGDSQ